MAQIAEHDAAESSISPSKDTVGKAATDLAAKPDEKITGVDIQREADKEYFSEIEKCVNGENVRDWNDPFHVVVQMTKLPYLPNVVRRRFFARRTLPQPQPDQTVWRYFPNSADMQLLWALPDLESINHISWNRHRLGLEYQDIGQMVVDYLEKKLYKDNLPSGEIESE